MGMYPDNIASRNTYEKIKFAKSCEFTRTENKIQKGVFDGLPTILSNCLKAMCAEMDQLKDRVKDLEKR